MPARQLCVYEYAALNNISPQINGAETSLARQCITQQEEWRLVRPITTIYSQSWQLGILLLRPVSF